MNKKLLGTVLFFGRKDCQYSKQIKNFLKKNSSKFYYIESSKIGEQINLRYNYLTYDYIFCFRSYYILKKNMLKKVKKFAINFHPGPPEFRGTGSVNYAVYENSKFYGCTAHIINEKVDYGKIIDVKRFGIKNIKSISRILNRTHKLMFKQANTIIKKIIRNNEFIENQILKNNKLKWSKKIKTLKDLKKFYVIRKNITKKDFLRKIRATSTDYYKPCVYLYGKKFILE